jgi:hypothetical protein
MDWVDELFVRRYDDLSNGLGARDDYERVKLAAGLRQMLLDESPLVHQANRERRLKFRFRVNNVGDSSALPIKPDLLFHAHGLDPDRFQVSGGTRELKLDQFLTHPLIEAPDGVVRIADVIRFAANKAGGVHLDPTRDAEEARLDAAMDRIAGLGVHPLAIALETITRISLAALRPLRDAIVKLPADLPLFAHYKLDRGGAIRFEGLGQFLETNFTQDFAKGFSWNAVIRIMRQGEPGLRTIYEIGNLNGDPPQLSIAMNERGALIASAEVATDMRLTVEAEGYDKSPLFDRFAYIGVDLCYGHTGVELALYLNAKRSAADSREGAFSARSLTRHTIGSRLDGQQSATYEIRELVLATRCPSAEERSSLANYMWMQWHD